MKSNNGYMPDISKTSLEEFKNDLKTGRLLPSRKPLLDDIDEKFSRLKNTGIRNAADLKKKLRSNSSLKKFAKETGIPENYLKLLKREVNNLLPTPVKFIDIPNISEKIVKQLNSLEIVDTENLFPHVNDSESRQEFKKLSGFSTDEILWLTKLVDISRIKWVGPKLARLILDTEYDTVNKLANGDPSEVLKAFNKAKRIHKAYQGALGINDIESWIHHVVVKVPLVIEY